MPRDASAGKSNRSEIIAVYNYVPIVSYDKDDALQRFGKVKVEATSFTISEPIFDMQVSAMLYDYATDEQKQILRNQYGVAPFSVKTITIERVFIDKLFAAEAYVRKSHESNRAFEAAKHIYDLAVVFHHPKITSLLCDVALLRRLLDIRVEEEKRRLDGIPNVMPCEFTFFKDAATNKNIKSSYDIMQNQYVLQVSERIPFANATEKLNEIENMLKQNFAWINYSQK